MTFIIRVLFLYFTLLVSYLSGNNSGLNRRHFNAQEKLIEKIVNKSGTRKQILPMADSSTPVLLRIGLGIRQIATVDEVNQALRLNVWLRLYWNNPFLSWNSTEYNNITSIHLDNGLVWTPDISMYNKASLEEDIDILYTRLSTTVIIHSDGNCTWLAPATLLSQCRINVRRFPFDEQVCLLTFGSWTYSALSLDVTPDGVDVKDFVPNGEWDIVEYPAERKVQNYTNDIPYADVTLTLRIKRQPLYYTLNLILPCTVIAILAFMAFVLPSDHGERVSLVITVLLAMSVYMLIVSSTLPQTSDAIPVIGTYFLCIIVEIALCLTAVCFVAKIRHHETDMPKWFDNLVNHHLARLLLMSNDIKDYDEVPKLIKVNGLSKTPDIALNDMKEETTTDLRNHKAVLKLHNELTVLTNDVSKRQKLEAKQRKWQNAARVLDRFFLLFFSLAFVIITAAVFA